VTKSFQTTTILYYTFFLPGVFLHEITYWFAAGIFNVHAKSSIQWPEAQEIAELKLSFVELAKNVSPFRLGLITLAPILAGLAFVWFIATNLLDFSGFFALVGTGNLSDISEAVRRLTSATDFWLWIYILFTISNTMIARLGDLRGLRIILIAIGIAIAGLVFVGVGNEVVVTFLAGSAADALYMLAGTFGIIIFIDLIFVAILGTIETIIERVTGDSAMFRRGKLIAMTQQEIMEMRQRQSRRDARALPSRAPREASRPTIYSRTFMIPGPPGDESVTQSETIIVEPDEKPALQTGPRPDTRRGPEVITGAVTNRPATPAAVTLPEDDEVKKVTIPAITTPKPASPFRPAQAADEGINLDDDDEEADEELPTTASLIAPKPFSLGRPADEDDELDDEDVDEDLEGDYEDEDKLDDEEDQEESDAENLI
jgi:hypothetical protein